MINSKPTAFALAAMLAAAPLSKASATETLPITALALEATIPLDPSLSLQTNHDGVLAFGFGSLWTVNHPNLMRIDPTTNQASPIELAGIEGPVRFLGIGEGAVWIADNGTDTIFKVDPSTNTVVNRFHAQIEEKDSLIGVGAGSVWLVQSRVLTRLNAESGAGEAEIKLPLGSSPGVIFDFGSAWVIGSVGNTLYRVDPHTNAIVSITDLCSLPFRALSAEGSIWVHCIRDGTVDRIDPVSGKVIAAIETDAVGVDFLAGGGGYIWLMTKKELSESGHAYTRQSAQILQIDPNTNTVVRKFVGDAIGDVELEGPMLSYGAGSLWILGKLSNGIVRVQPPQ